MVSQPNKEVVLPFIEMKSFGKPLTTLKVDLKAEIENTDLILGRANIQMIDENSILEPLVDYVQSIKDEYDGRKDWLNNISILLNQIDYKRDKIKGKLAFIHLFRIDPPFRKRHMTKPYLWLIMKALKENFNIDFVLLEAFPVEINKHDKRNFDKEKSRLEKIYFKSDFIRRSGYMFIDLRKKSFIDFV